MSPEYRTDMFDGKWLTPADITAMGKCTTRCPRCKREMPIEVENPNTGDCPICSNPCLTSFFSFGKNTVDPLANWREKANAWKEEQLRKEAKPNA